MPRGGRKKGVVSYKIDERIVPWLKDWCRVAKRERGLSAFEAIRLLVNTNPRLFGRHTADATVHRLYQKMKSGRYKLVPPPGMPWHWSLLTFEPLPLEEQKKSSKSK
jgi:hypothetical protein